MRKILLALIFGISSVAMAQADLAVTLNSPAANSTQGPGIPFSFDVTFTNNGTVDITPSDSIIFYPTLNGGLLSSGGQTIIYYTTGNTVSANGGTLNQAANFSGMNISGASAGQMNFCGVAFVIGPNWNGVTESDTTNNTSCNTFNYDPNAIGIAENMFDVSSENVKLADNSYFAKGIYHVDMVNVAASNSSMVVFDLTGKEVFNAPLAVEANSIKQDVSLNLNKGIYIVTIKDDANILSSKKIAVQ